MGHPEESSSLSSSAKILTQPDIGHSDKSSSSAKTPSLNTLTDKPYSIRDILASYNLPPSFLEEQLQLALESPVNLKVQQFKSDRDIITILKESETLRSQTLYQWYQISDEENWSSTFSGTASVIGKLTYHKSGSGNVIDCSSICMPIPPNTSRIEKFTTDGALFILLVADYHMLMNLASDLFHERFHCIVVTAGGPPDLLIRMAAELELPVLALLDAHPLSFKLLAFYGPRLKNLKWLGIRPSDINVASFDYRVIRMNRKEIKIAENLSNDDYLNSRPEWHQELHMMLQKKQKIALESLTCCGVASYVTEVFLPMKLQLEDWI